MTIDFWRVVMPNDEGSFESAIDAAAALPDDESRALDIHGAAIRLQDSTSTPTRREGEMMRIRMDEVPVRASLGGDWEPFEFEDDEGVGEETAFLYIPGLQTLVVQRNRFAVSVSRLAGYFEEAADLTGVITLEPVIEPGTALRFKKMNRIRKFQVKVAGVHNAATINSANPGVSTKKMADLIKDLSAPTFNFEATMGHESGTLDVATVKAMASSLTRIGSETAVDVRKIEVTGSAPGDELIVLDLLQDRMVENEDVELDNDRRLPYADRKGALRSAYKTRRTQLLSLFGTGGDG